MGPGVKSIDPLVMPTLPFPNDCPSEPNVSGVCPISTIIGVVDDHVTVRVTPELMYIEYMWRRELSLVEKSEGGMRQSDFVRLSLCVIESAGAPTTAGTLHDCILTK